LRGLAGGRGSVRCLARPASRRLHRMCEGSGLRASPCCSRPVCACMAPWCLHQNLQGFWERRGDHGPLTSSYAAKDGARPSVTSDSIAAGSPDRAPVAAGEREDQRHAYPFDIAKACPGIQVRAPADRIALVDCLSEFAPMPRLCGCSRWFRRTIGQYGLPPVVMGEDAVGDGTWVVRVRSVDFVGG
jgi:hypothetical protein